MSNNLINIDEVGKSCKILLICSKIFHNVFANVNQF